jgi:hypothetical protein
MQRDRYPDDWEAISAHVRFVRAGNCCEACGAPNGQLIWRKPGTAEFITDPLDDPHGDFALQATRVVLTVHHIGVVKPDGTPGDPHDKMDCRDENLIALCQRCHLLADLPTHIANAAATRARKKREAVVASGQLSLFSEAQS